MMELKSSFTNLLSLTSWAGLLLDCKEYQKLNTYHNADDQLNGSFRVTTFFKNPSSWFSCNKNSALPQLISHYLHLNLTFVKPNNDFDKKWDWYNGIHSSGLMKMLVNDKVDYIINDIYMNETLWHPNGIIAMTTALDDSYKINFLTKKYKIIKKFGNYNLVFDWSIWLVIIALVLIISAILCLNQMIKRCEKNLKFSWKLYFNLIIDNFSLLFSKHPSVILSKLIPRQFLMAAIPMLSILTISLFNSSHYSHAMKPLRFWCDSLECFVNKKPHSNENHYQFYQFEDGFIFNLMKNSNEFAAILNRTQFHKRGSNI